MSQMKYFTDVSRLDCETEVAKYTQLFEQYNIPKYFEDLNGLLDILEQQYLQDQLQLKKLEEYAKEVKSDEIKLKNEIDECNIHLEELRRENYMKKLAIQERQEKELASKEELDELRVKKISLEKELKAKTEGMAKEFKSYNIMTHHYKQNFDCHIVLEEPDKVIFEFEKRRERDVPSQCFVKLSTPDDGKTFELVELHPKLDCQYQLAERLRETNNVPGLLVFLRKQFKPLLKK